MKGFELGVSGGEAILLSYTTTTIDLEQFPAKATFSSHSTVYIPATEADSCQLGHWKEARGIAVGDLCLRRCR